ncbi:MAG: hypothetical protein JNL25_05900 [Rhodospirillaceae bacterium]|nr:hypothetical protein [Rhodospirillaceae bacterium]
MFGLPAFPKLVLIVVVIAAVWYFFRRTQVTKRQNDEQVRGGGGAAPAQKNAKPVEDMVQCPSCGAYVPAGTKCSCGKS